VRGESQPRAPPRGPKDLPARLARALPRLVRDFLAPRRAQLTQELGRGASRCALCVALEARLDLREAREDGLAPRRGEL
jgi:hypothetical protein